MYSLEKEVVITFKKKYSSEMEGILRNDIIV